MNAVPLDVNHGPRVGTARRLSDFDNAILALGCSPMRCYDVAEDGRLPRALPEAIVRK